MKLTYTDGCTCTGFDIDGKDLILMNFGMMHWMDSGKDMIW